MVSVLLTGGVPVYNEIHYFCPLNGILVHNSEQLCYPRSEFKKQMGNDQSHFHYLCHTPLKTINKLGAYWFFQLFKI